MNFFCIYLGEGGGGGGTNACICFGTHSQPLLLNRWMCVYKTWVTGVLFFKKTSSEQKATATNQKHSNDLEACGTKVSFRSQIFDAFIVHLYLGERQWPYGPLVFIRARRMRLTYSNRSVCPCIRPYYSNNAFYQPHINCELFLNKTDWTDVHFEELYFVELTFSFCTMNRNQMIYTNMSSEDHVYLYFPHLVVKLVGARLNLLFMIVRLSLFVHVLQIDLSYICSFIFFHHCGRVQRRWGYAFYQIDIFISFYTQYNVCHIHFYAPGLKGPPGASSVWIVRLSVCVFVRNSVPLIHKVKYLKFGWSYSNQTWTVSSSKGFSHFTDITCPWGLGGVKIWDLEILPYLDFVATGGIHVSQTHV